MNKIKENYLFKPHSSKKKPRIFCCIEKEMKREKNLYTGEISEKQTHNVDNICTQKKISLS